MGKNTIIVCVAILLVGLWSGYSLANIKLTPYGKNPDEMHHMADGTMMGQNSDQHFIVQMIPHHEGAIEMATLALQKSKRPEILALARAIIDAQTKEINDMKGWYSQWFNAAVPAAGMGMHMDSMGGDMAELAKAPAADFDRIFIDQMVPHHEMAIMMASMLKTSTDRPEMKQLTENIIASQTQEIEMMRTWKKTWYGL